MGDKITDWEPLPSSKIDDWEPMDKGSIFSQIKEGVTSPFQGEEKSADAETMRKAESILKSEGYDPNSVSSELWTGAINLADSITFGNQAEIKSAYEALTQGLDYEKQKEINEAILEKRSEDSPISAGLGSLGGMLVPGAMIKAPLKAGAFALSQAGALATDKAEEGEEIEALSRSVVEEAIGFGAGRLIGKGLSKAKGYRNAKDMKKSLEKSGLGSDQADRVVAKVKQYNEHYDKVIPTINQLDEKQAKEFEELILKGVKIGDYKHGDLDEGLKLYKDMLAKRKAMYEEVGMKSNEAAKWGMKFMDAQYVGNMIDRRYGTDVMTTMNEISRDFNQGLWEAKDLKEGTVDLFKRLNLKTSEDSDKLLKAVEAGKAPKEFTDFMEGMRLKANEMYGEEVIPFRKNYVPHYTKRGPEMIGALRAEIKDTLGDSYNHISIEDLKAIKGNDKLMDALKYTGGYVGKKERALKDEELLNLARSVFSGAAAKQISDIAAKSSRERIAEQVPELIREKDIGRLLGSWIDGVTSDAAMRKNLKKIEVQAEALKKTDPVAAAYLRNYANDVAGGSRAIAGATNKYLQEFSAENHAKAIAAKNAGNNIKSEMYSTIAEAPQMMQYMQAQLYPFFLGLRADAVVRNMTQPYMLTVPSISSNPAYATKLVAQSLPDSVKGFMARDKSKAVQELKAGGWLPPDPTPGQFNALRKGIGQGSNNKVVEGLNELAMWGYTQSDLANRVVTLGVGKTVAKDIMKGNKHALKYLKEMPPAYRKQAEDALRAGDAKALQDRVLDHLMATTQFNYNRASMSEYGREMGSAFSQFSKWPTAIGADIYDGYDAHKFSQTKNQTKLPPGSVKLLSKYMAPMMMLHMLDNTLKRGIGEESGDEYEFTPRQQVFLGKGLSSSAPIESVKVVTDPGRAFTPPIVQGVLEAAGGDFNTVLGVVPGAVWARTLTERLPPLIDNEKGKKPIPAAKQFAEDELGLDFDFNDYLD